jgi:hypothetical protein
MIRGWDPVYEDNMRVLRNLSFSLQIFLCFVSLRSEHLKDTELFDRISAGLHAVPAISTHEHLMPFQLIKPIERFQLHGSNNRNNPSEGALKRIWQATTFPSILQRGPFEPNNLFSGQPFRPFTRPRTLEKACS